MENILLFLVKVSNLDQNRQLKLLNLLHKLWNETSDTKIEDIIDEIRELVW